MKRLIVFPLVAACVAGASGYYSQVDRPGGIPSPAPIAQRLAAQNYSASLTELDQSTALLLDRAKSQHGDWIDQETLAGHYLSRAKLTGSYDDILAAQNAADTGVKMAIKGSGPLLSRAAVAITSHRLMAAQADLDAVDKFVAPELATLSEAKAMRGDLALARGQYVLASRLFADAGRMESWSGIHHRKAVLAYYLGDFEGAAEELTKADAINRNPTPSFRASMLVTQGEFDLAQGKWDVAEARFKEANQLFPGHWRTQMRVAQMRALNGEPGMALGEFERIAQISQAPEAMDIAAGLHRALGNTEQSKAWAGKANAIWQKRLTQLPEAAWGHAVEHELAFGDPKRALALAGKNARNRPHGSPLTLLAKAWLANGRADYALALCQKVERSGWVSADQWLTRADALVLRGRGEEAKAAQDKARAINPHALDRNPAFAWLDH